MIRYIFKRLLNLIPVAIIISICLFGILKMIPADPVQMMMPQGPGTFKSAQDKQEHYDFLKKKMGFDKPLPVQYIKWIERTVKGDFGDSTQYNQPVKKVIGEPLRNTFILNIGSTIISFVLAVFIGIRSAVKHGSFYDRFWQIFTLIGISLPTFFTAMMLVVTLAYGKGWFPPSGLPNSLEIAKEGLIKAWARYLVLPTITLTIGSLASTSRYVRNAMLDALSQDYIRTARSKGLSERIVIYRHAFRNALIPVVTVMAWAVIGMFSGAAITESIFAYDGIGRILVKAVSSLDYNVVLTLNMFYSLLMLAGNLLMDIGYALADPRIRYD
ncbi:MAG: ABC transporter permease [Saccharofermentanales bacterium]